MSEKRGDVRTAFRASVRLSHPNEGVFDVYTRDMSQNGIFLILKEFPLISVGDRVNVQSLDIDDAPVIDGEVVRVEATGIAIQYLLED